MQMVFFQKFKTIFYHFCENNIHGIGEMLFDLLRKENTTYKECSGKLYKFTAEILINPRIKGSCFFVL